MKAKLFDVLLSIAMIFFFLFATYDVCVHWAEMSLTARVLASLLIVTTAMMISVALYLTLHPVEPFWPAPGRFTPGARNRACGGKDMKIGKVVIYPVVAVYETGRFLRLAENAKIKVYSEVGMGNTIRLQALHDGVIFEHVWSDFDFSNNVSKKLSKEKGLDKLDVEYEKTEDWRKRERLREQLNKLGDEINKEVAMYMEKLRRNFIRAVEKRGFIRGHISGLEVLEPPQPDDDY